MTLTSDQFVPETFTAPSALVYGSRPDPALGLFETLLVEDGRPVLAEEHIARLAYSLRCIYGRDLDWRALRASIDAAAERCGQVRSRLRIEVDPDCSQRLSTEPALTPPGQRALLVPFTFPGGMGQHKFRDRSLVEALIASVPGRVPLLIDSDRTVLEAARANVFIVEGEALITPPTDGRILPGVSRGVLLRNDPHAREELFDLERLASADSIFLTGSVAGRRPARLTLESSAQAPGCA